MKKISEFTFVTLVVFLSTTISLLFCILISLVWSDKDFTLFLIKSFITSFLCTIFLAIICHILDI